jgi:hypothetical protein
MIDALTKHVSVTNKCYEMHVHQGKKVQLLVLLMQTKSRFTENKK